MKYNKIKIGDVLTLEDVDNSKSLIKEKVTSIKNPNSNDPCFQIATDNLSYDWTNFYYLRKVN